MMLPVNCVHAPHDKRITVINSCYIGTWCIISCACRRSHDAWAVSCNHLHIGACTADFLICYLCIHICNFIMIVGMISNFRTWIFNILDNIRAAFYIPAKNKECSIGTICRQSIKNNLCILRGRTIIIRQCNHRLCGVNSVPKLSLWGKIVDEITDTVAAYIYMSIFICHTSSAVRKSKIPCHSFSIFTEIVIIAIIAFYSRAKILAAIISKTICITIFIYIATCLHYAVIRKKIAWIIDHLISSQKIAILAVAHRAVSICNPALSRLVVIISSVKCFSVKSLRFCFIKALGFIGSQVRFIVICRCSDSLIRRCIWSTCV